MFRPLNPLDTRYQRKSAAVAERIIALIRTDQIHPGQSLPSERDIAAQMKVSRGVVREALSALQISGMVHIRVGEGTFVCPSPNLEGDATQALTLLEGNESPLELWDARREVEAALICLASEKATPADHKAVLDILTQMARAVELEQDSTYLELNYRFHILLIVPANNTILKRIAEDLFQKTHQILSSHVAERYVRNHATYSLKKHHHIFELYKKQDIDALRRSIYTHFEDLKEFFLKD
ncbi:MAG: GntR family transcriptional regulator [Deinococcota bacterium]